jgi:hypothetical protein
MLWAEVGAFGPIRIDDAVMDTDQVWAADLCRGLNIGDFRSSERKQDVQLMVVLCWTHCETPDRRNGLLPDRA